MAGLDIHSLPYDSKFFLEDGYVLFKYVDMFHDGSVKVIVIYEPFMGGVIRIDAEVVLTSDEKKKFLGRVDAQRSVYQALSILESIGIYNES